MRKRVFLDNFSINLFLTGFAAFVFGSLCIYLDCGSTSLNMTGFGILMTGAVGVVTLWWGRRRAVRKRPECVGPLGRPDKER